jgi:NAD(P)-dependent dehydrogenase (short-subunit alcohol dehydrogenase family)
VSQHESVKTVFNKIFQEGRVHILVNNAGISHVGNLEGTPEPDFDRVFSVNVKGMYNCMHASAAHMKANGGGIILNMASIAGTSGLADRFAYSMSKGAVVAMTYSVAKDYLAHNIRCNCISPARVHTPFVDGFLNRNYPGKEQEMFEKLEQSQPIGRMARPEEIAALALYLCSDDASFITGSDYPIDGGFDHRHEMRAETRRIGRASPPTCNSWICNSKSDKTPRNIKSGVLRYSKSNRAFVLLG